MTEPFEAGARRSMLERLAGGLAILAHAPELEWTCCFQPFEHGCYSDVSPLTWGWRFCNGGMPCRFFETRPCGHWHHRHEWPPVAYGATP